MSPLVLSEEQESIKRMARDFVADKMPVAHLRALRDERDSAGFSRAIWREMAALGFAGMTVPEALGGAGLGFAELGLVVEECGRTLAPTPILSTVVLGAGAIMLSGSEAQKRAWLPGVCAGESVLALAHDEGTRHARYRVTTSATRIAGGYRLDGEKTFVLDGHVADAFVVVARLSGEASDRDGIALFLVRRDAPGVTVTRTSMVDSLIAARFH